MFLYFLWLLFFLFCRVILNGVKNLSAFQILRDAQNDTLLGVRIVDDT